jgi:hypothetical protein
VSFFDEADEPPRTEIRRPSGRGGRRRTSGSGGSGSGRGSRRRPPSRPPQQSVRTRRAIALLGLVILIVVIAVGVSSCEGSANKSALQNYADNVNTLIGNSDATSRELFSALAKAGSTSASTTGQSVAQASAQAETQLRRAEALSVPGAVQSAQRHLVQALQERVDGLTVIAKEIQPALGSEHQQAVQEITAQMARFLSSDVEYKLYAAPEIASALHGVGLTVGGADGTPINPGQFLPSIDWLKTSFVGAQLGVAVSSGKSGASQHVTGLHGDALTGITYNGSTLADGTSVTSSPPPTFVLSVQNQGNYTETDVVCKVAVNGTSITGTKLIPSIAKGATQTCSVTLRGSPPAGSYNLKATVEPVPGEHDVANNSRAVSVVFH